MLQIDWLPIEGQRMAFRTSFEGLPPAIHAAVMGEIAAHGFSYDAARDVWTADAMKPARAVEFMACLADHGAEILASGTDGKPPAWIEENPVSPDRRHGGEVPF